MNETPRHLTEALEGRYRLERELGRGGMAVVYLAEDLRHRRHVAVKVLLPDLARSLGADRFLREIEIVAGLSHSHILPLHDSGAAGDDVLYYVMPYVEGDSLRSLLARERQLPVEEALRLAREVAEALAYAHARGIVHRDIKPENILLQSGHALVSDFGIARAVHAAADERLTETGIAIGTPAYMSPEQASAERDVDARSDVYSLGCVLYEMLAGEPPFTGPSAQAVLARKLLEPLPRLRVIRPDAPQAVEDVATRALARAPADRYPTAERLAGALAEATRAVTRGPTPGAARVAPHGSARRRRGWAAAVVGLAVIAAGVALLIVPGRPRASAPRLTYEQLTDVAASATSPALSPDGKLLTYILGEGAFFGPGQIYVKRLPDGEAVRLTDDASFKMGPRFSPDGARVAYTVLGAGWETWSVPVPPAAGAPRVWLHNAEGLSWTADAGLLYSRLTGRDIQLAVVAATASGDTTHTVYLPPEDQMAHRSRLSPDGNQVIVVEMDYHAWLPCRVVPFDGSSTGRVVGPTPAQCTDAAWSPDGEWMYFSANAGDGFHIWRQRSSGTAEPEQLTSGVDQEEGLEPERGGHSFLTAIGRLTSTVWVHDSQGDRQITTERFGSSPSLAADGKRLFYLVRGAGARTRFESAELWEADLTSAAAPRRVLPGVLMQFYDVSDDGTRVVYVASNDSTRSPLYVATVDGRTPPRRLLRDEALEASFGARDDVFYSTREGNHNVIYRVSADGSERRLVVRASDLLGSSPDGAWISTWQASLPDGRNNAIVLYPTAGGAPRLICVQCGPPPAFERGRPPSPANWSRDGRWFYLNVYDAPYALPLRPGEAVPAIPAGGLLSGKAAAAIPGARRVPQPYAFVGLDPDRYAFTRVTIQRNIYRVTLP